MCPRLQDEFYNRYLVKNHLMAPVVAAFVGEPARRSCAPPAERMASALHLWKIGGCCAHG